jgi:hypothetical protein
VFRFQIVKQVLRHRQIDLERQLGQPLFIAEKIGVTLDQSRADGLRRSGSTGRDYVPAAQVVQEIE